MANPFTSAAISNYNANPPADDGTAVSANQVKWSTIKTKLDDPIKTLAEADITNTNAAFSKIIGGGGFTSTAISYTVLSTDQGKWVKATASGITITTPDATSVGSPFVFIIVNESTGTITVAGNNPGVQQNVDGVASFTVPAGAGCILNTDGTNWFTGGTQGTLVGKQLMYGDIINGTIAESNGTNATTFSLKTLAGNDPSASDPVLICFRNATTTTGNYVYRSVAAATSLTISAGSTLGTSNATACRIWLVLFDDAGTVRMGAINCRSGNNIYPLGRNPIASSTAEGGAGAADSAQVFYTGTAVTSKPYLVFAHATYESGLSTAGNWNVDPNLRLQGNYDPLPGTTIQSVSNIDGAAASGSTAIPNDNTIPQSTEGTQFMTQAITPTSAANILKIQHIGNYTLSTGAGETAVALFQDTTANALAANFIPTPSSNVGASVSLWYAMLSGTAVSTTFKIRAGDGSGGTVEFNGLSTGGARYGGVMASYLSVDEIIG